MGAMSRLVQSFVDFVYPPSCVSCDALLDDGAKHICWTCWHSLPRIDRTHPLFRSTFAKLLERDAVRDLISVFVFEKDGAFQDLVHALKYEGFQSVGLRLGRELGKTMKQNGVRADCLVPVPLHRAKLRERGFNQSELIARGAAEVINLPVKTEWLVRTRETVTQTQLSQEKRERNVRGAFALSEKGHSEVDGKLVVIVDDVITTGSTLVSCSEQLRLSGAARILAASVALAE